jgi:hypothetical protein
MPYDLIGTGTGGCPWRRATKTASISLARVTHLGGERRAQEIAAAVSKVL